MLVQKRLHDGMVIVYPIFVAGIGIERSSLENSCPLFVAGIGRVTLTFLIFILLLSILKLRNIGSIRGEKNRIEKFTQN